MNQTSVIHSMDTGFIHAVFKLSFSKQCKILCFNPLCQGWPTSQRPTATFPIVLPQRATSHTWAHMNVTPSLPHSNTYLCSATFIVNITHQHDKDRNLQAVYCYVCYLVGFLIIT